MHYFAYGSNMSSKRMTSRVPSATIVETGFLFGHRLNFHKTGRKDGTAKCDAFHTADLSDFVAGVLYQIDPAERQILDKIEGLGNGYDLKAVTIRTKMDRAIEAFTYYATNIDRSLKPLDWYIQHVLYGARENNLPADYIEEILSIESIIDQDTARAKNELAVYR